MAQPAASYVISFQNIWQSWCCFRGFNVGTYSTLGWTFLCIRIYSNVYSVEECRGLITAYYHPHMDSRGQTVVIYISVQSLTWTTVYDHSNIGCMESVESFECSATLVWIMWLIPEPLVLPPLITDQQFWEVIEGRSVNDGYSEAGHVRQHKCTSAG